MLVRDVDAVGDLGSVLERAAARFGEVDLGIFADPEVERLVVEARKVAEHPARAVALAVEIQVAAVGVQAVAGGGDILLAQSVDRAHGMTPPNFVIPYPIPYQERKQP